MKKVCAAAALSLVLVAYPAAAWWDQEDCCDESPWEAPAYEEPVWDGPAWEAEPAWGSEPVWEPISAWEPEPAAPAAPYEPPFSEPVEVEPPRAEPVAYEPPVAEPPDAPLEERAELDEGVDKWAVAAEGALHRVDTVAIANERTTSGLRTTFTTTTETMRTESAAKLIAVVGTGEASGYDDVLWNGRMRRADGRLVGGSVYENFVWDGVRWVHDKYVYFQDDAETGQLPVEPPIPTSPVFTEPPPRVPPPPLDTEPPFSAPPTVPQADPPAPQPRDREDPRAVGTPAPLVIPPTRSAAPRAVRAAIALAPQADGLETIEVLRGRRIRLWPRAFVDGAPGTVTAWRLRSGEVTALGPLSGAGDEPLVAMWERITLPADPFVVVLDVTVSVAGESARTVPAVVTVVVRSPAIVE